MKVYLVKECDTVESGEGYSEVCVVVSAHASEEGAKEEAAKRSESIPKGSWRFYEIESHEVF